MRQKGRQVLFLDFDGVLNSVAFFLTKEGMNKDMFRDNMDFANVRLINYVMLKCPSLEIVVSSSWGVGHQLNELREGLTRCGLSYPERITGITPKNKSSLRHEEIEEYLLEAEKSGMPVSKWITVDDKDVFPPDSSLRENEVKTSNLNGIVLEDAFRVIKHFEPDYQVPTVLL